MKTEPRLIPRGTARTLFRAFQILRAPVKPIPKRIRHRLFGFTSRAVSRLRLSLFTPREDDIFIVTFPRSGTTWTQMMLYQLATGGEGAPEGLHSFSPTLNKIWKSGFPYDELPSPRVLKSHSYYRELPRWPGRYIYVLRDGRDAAVSLYNLRRTYYGCTKTFEQFFDEVFLPTETKAGGWARHVRGWCTPREGEEILLLRFEEMKRDLGGTLRRIAEYCGFELTAEQLTKVEERCSFDFMKRHEAALNPFERGDRSSFIRKGKSGGWKAHLSPEQNARFEEECRRKLAPLGLHF